MYYDEIFQKNLKAVREASAISQTQLADDVYVSQSLIAHTERGFKIPSVETICRIADRFGCSLDELFGRNEYVKEFKYKKERAKNDKAV